MVAGCERVYRTMLAPAGSSRTETNLEHINDEAA
jgi:hypothetical protein